MSTFVFNGKTYKIVQDTVLTLVDGCNKCAFIEKPDECADVDGVASERDSCCVAPCHYEEVK